MKSCLFSVLDVPWMVFNDLTPQHIPVDMGINFGCCDGLVSQHTLYGTQVRASFQQVGSEGMTEGVRADMLVDARTLDGPFEDREDHHARKLSAAVVEKYDLFARACAAPLFEIPLDLVPRRVADRHQPLFVAFADDADVSLAEKEVREPQRGQLRDAQAARVEHFEHGAVAQPLGRTHIDGGDDTVDLVGGEDVGQRTSEFGRVDELGGRTFDLVVYQQEVEETADAAQTAGLRSLFAPAVVKPRHVTFDHRSLDPAGGDVVLAQNEMRELAQVAHVRFDGILREAFFEFDIG